MSSSGTERWFLLLLTFAGLMLAKNPTSAAEYSFTNPDPIQVPEAGNALGYPSPLPVTGVQGFVTKITVTLLNLQHPRPSDLDVLLVGPAPAQAAVVLMGSTGDAIPADDVTIAFDDAAPALLPANSGLFSGTFRPTNYGQDVFDSPAPQPPYGNSLSLFNGTSHEGVWELYVRDHLTGEEGVIAGGWTLRLSTDPPAIVNPPSETTTGLGGVAIFCVNATGADPLRFQWRHNGVVIEGATDPCLSLFELRPEDFGSYSVTVANDFGAVTSPGALLLLNGQRVPGSDSFAGATPLGLPGGLIWSDNQSASREKREPNHAGKPGGKSVWYQLFTPNPGVARFSTKGSSFDTLLAVYTGNDLDQLAVRARDDDRGGFFTSEVQFNVQQGRTYYIAVDGYAGEEGVFLLEWLVDSQAPLLPVIFSPPVSQTVREGKDAFFSVDTQDAGARYQWYFFDQPLEGETGPTLTRPHVQPGDVGTYSVRITNDRGGVLFSDPVLLEIGPFSGFHSVDKWPDLTYSVLSGGGGSAFISVRAGQSTFSQVLNNSDALTSALEVNHCGVSPSFTRWIGLTNEDSGEFEIDTVGSAVPTLLAVYYLTDLTVLHEVACDRSDPSGRPCRVTFRAFTGTNYYVLVDGLSSAKGTIALNWNFGIRLSAQKSGTDCLLSWFAPNGEYEVQSSLGLLNPPSTTAWTTMTSAPSFLRGSNVMAVTLPDPPATLIFRLHKP